MDMWVILDESGKKRVFPSFKKASDVFRKMIKDYIYDNNDVFLGDSMPFQVGCYFAFRWDEGKITDEEIAINARLQRLLDSLTFPWPKARDYAISSVPKDIDYLGFEDEFDNEKVEIHIRHIEMTIELDLTHDDGVESYIRTNAFLLMDRTKEYYFNSSQIVTCCEDAEELLRPAVLNIRLKKIEVPDPSDQE